MFTLAQRLSPHWKLIESLLGILIPFVLGLGYWVMNLGGKQRLLKWIVEVESSDQNDAAQRIMCGCKALLSESGATTACYDFIGGMDQWRAAQSRIAQRQSCVRRSGSPICVFLVFAVAVFILQIFEPPTRPWSALCVVLAAIAFVWLFWTIFPVAYVAWQKGLPHPTDTKTAPHLEHAASPIEIPPQPVTVKGNVSAAGKVDSTRTRD